MATPAQINGGHTAGNRGARIRLIGALHTLFSRAGLPTRLPDALNAAQRAQCGAMPFSSSVARCTVSGWETRAATTPGWIPVGGSFVLGPAHYRRTGAVDSAGLVPFAGLVFLIVRNRQQQLAHGAVGNDAWRMRAMA